MPQKNDPQRTGGKGGNVGYSPNRRLDYNPISPYPDPRSTPQKNKEPAEGAAASGGMAPTESASNNVPNPDNYNPPVKGSGRALYPKQGV